MNTTNRLVAFEDELSVASPALSRYESTIPGLAQSQCRQSMEGSDDRRYRTGPPPPPPPPPPSALQSSTPILQSSWRSSTNSHVATRSPVSATPTASSPNVDAATIQHAAAGLRKTGYNESIRSNESYLSDGRLDGSNERVSGRDWTHGALAQPVERNQTRTTVYASSTGSGLLMPVGDVYQSANQMNSSVSPVDSRRLASPASSQHYSSWSTSYEQHQQQTNRSPSSPQYRYNIAQQSSPIIPNPQAYIHAYATRTMASPTSGTSPTSLSPGRQKLAELSGNTKFCRELRDQGLTSTQRIANRYQYETLPARQPPQHLRSVYSLSSLDPVDQLIFQMQENMATGRFAAGEQNCAKCGIALSNEMPGCTAIGQTFHVACFQCAQCDKSLAGCAFYAVDGKPFCEVDYMNTLEKCNKCAKPITEKLLRASGKTFHPLCFVCSVCNLPLDGAPFTVDTENNVHCVPCFHEKFAPRCAVCGKAIVPDPNAEESVRVVAMDKSFHVKCYCCEDCGMQLSSKIEGHGCYPLDGHLYCKSCNVARIRAITA